MDAVIAVTGTAADQPRVIRRRAIGREYIALGVLLAALGAALLLFGPREGDSYTILAAVICLLVGIAIVPAVIVSRGKAGKPFLVLSTDGIRFVQFGNVRIGWDEVLSLGETRLKGNRGLIISMTDAAHARLPLSALSRASAQLDKATQGAKAVTIWSAQIEDDLETLVSLIQRYSTAHRARPLTEAVA